MVPVLEKRLLPSVAPVKDGVVVVMPPRPRLKPEATGCCCGAVDVRMEPNDKPAPAVGAVVDVVVVVLREKGTAEAVGLLKARLKPVVAAEVAGVPDKRQKKQG